MRKKTDLVILLETAFYRVNRGAPVLTAVYECLNELGDNLSDEVLNFFNDSKIQISLGRDFIEILSESDLFKASELHSEKKLLENAYLDPARIKQHWLDWFLGAHPPEVEGSPVHLILPTIFSNNGHLWIVGDNEAAVKTLVRTFGNLDAHSNCQIFLNENYESIALRCKMGKLKPAKSQFVLWVDSNSKGQPVVTGFDEVTGRIPGSSSFSFATIFQIKRNGKMYSTGYVPYFFGDLAKTVAEALTHKLFKAG